MAEQAQQLRGEFSKAYGETALDFNEMTLLIRKGNADISTSELRKLFNAIPKNANGKIEFGDLVDYIFQDIVPAGPSGGNAQKYSKRVWDPVRDVLSKVYGPDSSATAINLLMAVVKEHDKLCGEAGISQEGGDAVGTNDATLITYANTFEDHKGGEMPIRCLSQFMQRYNVASTMKCIHMLPMFPWDTDRGFSVKDFYKVDPRYGDWQDVEDLGTEKNGSPTVMFDYVCNHVSVENPWAQGSLIQRHIPEGHPFHKEVQMYKDFLTMYADEDGPAEDQKPSDEVLSKLTRPRANPPLTRYFVCESRDGQSAHAFVGTPEVDMPAGWGRVLGKGYVWTTFSRGQNKVTGIEETKQLDLNYRNIKVLAEVVRVLLFYVRKGSTIIRLDAIGYIWKVLGSNSIHERGTHMLLAILYKVLKLADPRVMTVAEVNEPVSKCLPYLGSGDLPESNMVYNFAPFPMALHAQIVNNVELYSNFLGTMEGFKGKQFITVLGSHDGMAQKQVREILPPEELDRLHHAFIHERDGHVNYAYASGGVKIVYEVCGTPWCLVNGTEGSSKDSFDVQLARYINALCLGLLPRGMPGIYAQGLIGAENYNPAEGLDEYRTLNRESYDINKLFVQLDDANNRYGATLRAVQGVMGQRAIYSQYDRNGPEPKILKCLDPAVLAVLLEAPTPETPPMVVLINVANATKKAEVGGLPRALLDCKLRDALEGYGAIMRKGGLSAVATAKDPKVKQMALSFKADVTIEMAPFEVIWLVREGAGFSGSGVPRSLHTGLGEQWELVREVVGKVYGGETGESAMTMLKDVVREHVDIVAKEGLRGNPDEAVSNIDATLITYANTFVDSTNEHMPIGALSQFFQKYGATDSMKCVHMLPMFPWDTDRGFSVMDYWKVDPRYGTWDDVSDLSTEKNGSPTIMFDYVCNHASALNPWCQGGMLQRHLTKEHPMYASVQKYKDFVTAYATEDGPAEQQKPTDEMLSKLTRPRANPPLTPYFIAESRDGKTAVACMGTPEADSPADCGRILGKGYVWTTFSRGLDKDGKEGTKQVDLNYRNPEVLAEVVRVLLFYVRKGSTIIRLDAIGYIWKVLGSQSIHERGTHMLLAILYRVMKLADPRVMTVAEVNEPVSKCLPYLGTEKLPESNMVYNFAPFPMALHAQIVKDVSQFASFLGTMGEFKGNQFLTVLGSHDGLAQKQVREILPPEELDRLHSAFINERHGHCNFAFASGGKKIVYEVCGTPWCLVNGPQEKATEPFKMQLARYINALCFGLIPKGMPGIYAQGLIGAENYHPKEGLDEYRTLNRESFDIQELFPKLDDPESREGATFRAVQEVMGTRLNYPQHDRRGAEPEVIQSINPAVLACVLRAPACFPDTPPMVVIVNSADETRKCEIAGMPAELIDCKLRDALDGAGGIMRSESLRAQSKASAAQKDDNRPGWFPELSLELAPYEVLWMVKQVTSDAAASKGRRSIRVKKKNA